MVQRTRFALIKSEKWVKKREETRVPFILPRIDGFLQM
jgi:hypothetical protein